VFAKTCMQCHALFGTGGKIGPDLTGSNRANLHYVLENVLDPSAMVGNAYQMTTVVTTGGRVISGIIQAATSSSVTVQTANERVVLSRDDVDEMVPSPVSMMPEGVVAKLEKDHLRDLIAYLASKSQVPLPAGAKVEVGE